MRVFYHVTATQDLQAILENGLEPRLGPRSAMLGEKDPAIYFFDDLTMVEDALGNWLGDAFEEHGISQVALLEFCEADLDGPVMHDGLSYFSTTPIAASALRVTRHEVLDF